MLKQRMREALDSSLTMAALAAQLFAALGDRSVAADDALPDTGIPLDRERQLSAAFIRTPDARYGTRCSTVVVTERTARQPVTHVFERSIDAAGAVVLLRSTSLRNWPPRDSDGGLVEAVDGTPRPDADHRPAAPTDPSRRSRLRSLRGPATNMP
jgi:hypothetical protein